MELLVIYTQTANKAFEILGDESGLFGDNGGDPDGGVYMRPYNSISPDKAQQIIDSDLGCVAAGKEIPYQRNDDGEYPFIEVDDKIIDWCGYQADNIAYVVVS